jgi:hypothetical protein
MFSSEIGVYTPKRGLGMSYIGVITQSQLCATPSKCSNLKHCRGEEGGLGANLDVGGVFGLVESIPLQF